MEIVFASIAIVKNSRKEPLDDDWGSILSTIELAPEIPTEALDHVEEFSHLEVIYYFNQVEKEKVVYSGHPRGNPNYPSMGIFAQRKKDRPNTIGLCTVELVAHQGRTITVKFLDAIDGTPVLDIKPVFREFGVRGEVRQPAWVGDLMKKYW